MFFGTFNDCRDGLWVVRITDFFIQVYQQKQENLQSMQSSIFIYIMARFLNSPLIKKPDTC